MPALLLLGLIFVIGLFALYLFNTKSDSSDEDIPEENNLKKEENVIFLPNDIEKEKQKHKRKK